jgi:hypothetical protein
MDHPPIPGLQAAACLWCAMTRALSGDPEIRDLAAHVIEVITTNDRYRPSTRTTYSAGVRQFETFCLTRGITRLSQVTESVVTEFRHLPTQRGARRRIPTEQTCRNRMKAVRELLRIARQIGLHAPDVTVDIDRHRVTRGTFHRLDDNGIAALRTAARLTLPGALAPVLIALIEAGAHNGELVGLNHTSINGTTVSLPGGTRLNPRTNRLTEHGQHVMATAGNWELPASTASLSATFKHIATFAGFKPELRVRPQSVIAWRAAQIFNDTHRIEDVARFAGFSSLDTAAELIDFDWRSVA